MTSRRARAAIAGAGTEAPAIPLTAFDLALMRVSEVARAFEGRWSVRTLKRIDPQLHALFEEQRADWHAALVTRDLHECQRQTEAMVRGWQALIRRMEEAQVPEDAFLVGMKDDITVIVSESRAGGEAMRQRFPGGRFVFVTPDEVAAMVVQLGDVALRVKEMWPEAEIVAVRGADADTGERGYVSQIDARGEG